MKRIKLLFDKRVHPDGSKEHYWHFMLGYLLPSIHYYFKNSKKSNVEQSSKMLFVYDDCGPLMNPLIAELTNLMEIPYQIIDSKVDNESQKYEDEIYLPRWDVRMYIGIYFIMYFNRYNSKIPIKISDVKWFINKNVTFRQKAVGINLKKDILCTRNLILEKIRNIEKPEKPLFLFLDRSNEHNYYAKNGKAEIKGYGKSRRALINLKEGCDDLKNSGVAAAVYQPGSHSLLNQIKTFNEAEGIIAMRGAELANMIWMEPKSHVVVLGFEGPAFHLYNFACLLNLRLTERMSDSNYPDIQSYNIKNLIKTT